MFRAHQQELSLGQLRLLAGALDLRATQPIDLRLARPQFLEDLKRHVERRGGDRVEDDLGDRVIESGAGDGLTGGLGPCDPVLRERRAAKYACC